MSTISLTVEATGLPMERMKKYEVPLTLADKLKKTDIQIFSSTLNNSNLKKAICTVVFVGNNSVFLIQKILKQGNYDNIEITELLTLLHVMAELKNKSQDAEFRDLFQIENASKIRDQFNLNNMISKKVIEKTMQNQFAHEACDYAFLLGLIQPQINHAYQLGIDIKLDYDFQYQDYTIYCNLLCHKALVNDHIVNYKQIYSIGNKKDHLSQTN